MLQTNKIVWDLYLSEILQRIPVVQVRIFSDKDQDFLKHVAQSMICHPQQIIWSEFT